MEMAVSDLLVQALFFQIPDLMFWILEQVHRF